MHYGLAGDEQLTSSVETMTSEKIMSSSPTTSTVAATNATPKISTLTFKGEKTYTIQAAKLDDALNPKSASHIAFGTYKVSTDLKPNKEASLTFAKDGTVTFVEDGKQWKGKGAEFAKLALKQNVVTKQTLYVHANSLNIRDNPNSSAKSVGKLLRGDKVEVLYISKEGWATLDGNKYVMASSGYLAKGKPAPLKKTVAPPAKPTASTPDQPPPPPQDTEAGPPVGMILGGLAAVAVLYYFFTRK